MARPSSDFVACDQPFASRLTLHILAIVAEDEARRISERTKAALQAAKARGKKLGSPIAAQTVAMATAARSRYAAEANGKVRLVVDGIQRVNRAPPARRSPALALGRQRLGPLPGARPGFGQDAATALPIAIPNVAGHVHPCPTSLVDQSSRAKVFHHPKVRAITMHWWNRVLRSPSFGLRGRIDTTSQGRICGWAFDSEHPEKRLTIEFFADEELLGTACADLFRQDLATADIGDGRYGFTFDLRAETWPRQSLSARIAGTRYWLEDPGGRDVTAEDGYASPAAGIPADWASSLVDARAFRREQHKLAHVWTFLGFAHDAENDGDWFRAVLATREVFVQRFGTELRGFENVCRHRHNPLRRQERGNGPIICGFHQWQYNRDGLAIGIPKCRELYGKLPHELDARLVTLEVATCGSLVFGRFPSDQATQSLEDFLDDGFPILDALTRRATLPERMLRKDSAANWKLNLHITQDECHAFSIHTRTIGSPDSTADLDQVIYRRFGVHSAYLRTPHLRAFDRLVAGCRDGTYGASHYVILQIQPNLVVGLVPVSEERSHCVIQQFSPVAHDRTSWRAWLYRSPLDAPPARRLAWLHRLIDSVILHFAAIMTRRVFDEDREVCEQIQQVAHQIESTPLLGRLERRIGWFEEFYRDQMAMDYAREQ